MKRGVSCTMKRGVLHLTELLNGESGIVLDVDGSAIPNGRQEGPTKRFRHRRGIIQRLMDLGLTPGAKVVVVKSAPLGGPIEILVRGSRIALGRGMASKIMVEVTE